MNAEKLLNEAESAIYDRVCHANANCVLGIADGKVLCLPRRHSRENFHAAIELTAEQMNHGMTPTRWNTVQNKLWKLYKELKL